MKATKGELMILDQTGHTSVAWDTTEAATVDAARARFNYFRECGYAAFKLNTALAGGSLLAAPETLDGELIKTFDPEAEHVVMIAPLVGG
jgi:hypothetical protein